MEQNRWKSKVVWAGILSTLMMLMGNLGLYETLGITEEWLKTVIDLTLSLLAAFGVLNNPTAEGHF